MSFVVCRACGQAHARNGFCPRCGNDACPDCVCISCYAHRGEPCTCPGTD